jgi:adenylosuccinate lyase
MNKMTNQNILSQRYATPEINAIFSERGKILAERELWIAVMKSQRELGLDISAEEIEKYESVKNDIDLDKIAEIESRTRHDIKAKIESFVLVAKAKEHIHKGMTSRDLTDNVEQMQIRKASQIVLGRYISVVNHMANKARDYAHIELTARTHHQPAELTLLGRRFTMWAEELYHHILGFQTFLENMPLRGIKGPVGTQASMLNLLGSDEKVRALEQKVAGHLGFKKTLISPGQIYPRSLDFDLLANLTKLGSACSNFAYGMRLMSGYELVTEGFKEGQVGSSAMPHKMNTRSSERINGFMKLLRMYSSGASELAGDQWEEGDVSDSVVRRVIIPDAFYAIDGMSETTLTVLNEMGTYDTVISNEVDKYIPFLATTQILTAAMQAGIGREQAHEVIKKYAVSEALKMREGKEPRLDYELGQNELFSSHGIGEEQIKNILNDREDLLGNAKMQTKQVIRNIEDLCHKSQQAATYEPRDIN